jgi:hypothetical protein
VGGDGSTRADRCGRDGVAQCYLKVISATASGRDDGVVIRRFVIYLASNLPGVTAAVRAVGEECC